MGWNVFSNVKVITRGSGVTVMKSDDIRDARTFFWREFEMKGVRLMVDLINRCCSGFLGTWAQRVITFV